MLLIVLNYYQSLSLHTQNNQSLKNLYQTSCEHTRERSWCCAVSAGGFCFFVVLTHQGQGKRAWELLAGSLTPFFLAQVMFYTFCPWSKREGSDLHLLLMTHSGDWEMFWAFLILPALQNYLGFTKHLSPSASLFVCLVIGFQLLFLGKFDFACLARL